VLQTNEVIGNDIAGGYWKILLNSTLYQRSTENTVLSHNAIQMAADCTGRRDE